MTTLFFICTETFHCFTGPSGAPEFSVSRVPFLSSCPHRFLSPEQEEKAVDLQHHSDDGPANQHHKHTSQEEAGGLHLVLLEEEAEGPLQPDDEGKSGNKQDLCRNKWAVQLLHRHLFLYLVLVPSPTPCVHQTARKHWVVLVSI